MQNVQLQQVLTIDNYSKEVIYLFCYEEWLWKKLFFFLEGRKYYRTAIKEKGEPGPSGKGAMQWESSAALPGKSRYQVTKSAAQMFHPDAPQLLGMRAYTDTDSAPAVAGPLGEGPRTKPQHAQVFYTNCSFYVNKFLISILVIFKWCNKRIWL